MYKGGKNGIQQRRAGLAERSRAGAGGAVVMGLNPAPSYEFFFFHFRKIFKVFWRASLPVLEAINFQYWCRSDMGLPAI